MSKETNALATIDAWSKVTKEHIICDIEKLKLHTQQFMCEPCNETTLVHTEKELKYLLSIGFYNYDKIKWHSEVDRKRYIQYKNDYINIKRNVR